MQVQCEPRDFRRPTSASVRLGAGRRQTLAGVCSGGSQQQASASVQGRRAAGQVDVTVFGPWRGLAKVPHALAGVRSGDRPAVRFFADSIFQANPSLRVPSCQGILFESSSRHAGRVNFDWRLPALAESVLAEAGNVVRASRPGKPPKPFAPGIHPRDRRECLGRSRQCCLGGRDRLTSAGVCPGLPGHCFFNSSSGRIFFNCTTSEG